MKKKCIVCEKEFECYDSIHHGAGRKRISKRRVNSVTCSKLCARTYERIRRSISCPLYTNIRKLKNQLKKNGARRNS